MVPAPEFVARAIGGLLALLCACAPSGELAPSTRLVAAAVQAGGPNPDASLLSLTVTGACSVRYEVTTVTTDGAAWLRLPQGGTGTIAPGQTRTVLVGFDVVSTNLRAGTYVGSLIVTGRCDDLEGRMARGSPLVVPASLNVTPGPVVPPVCGERMPGVEAEPMNEGPCNDTLATAEVLDPNLQQATGTLNQHANGPDVDFYRFEVASVPSIYRVTAEPDPNQAIAPPPRPVVDVMRADGSLHAAGPGGVELDDAMMSSREVLFTTPGTYYLRVQNTPGGASGPNAAYIVSAQSLLIDSGPNAFFPADLPSAINTPSAGVPFADLPRWRVYLPAGSTLSTRVLAARLASPSILDLRLLVYEMIYDMNGQPAPVLVFQNDNEDASTIDPGGTWTTPHDNHYLVVVDWTGPFVPNQALQLQMECASGHLPFALGGLVDLATCLRTPARDETCAPELPSACANRPNLLSNGGFEVAPQDGLGPPPSWTTTAMVLDSGCAAMPPEPDCYQFDPSFFGPAVGAFEQRRFAALSEQGLAQSLAEPLVAGRTYHLRVAQRRSPQVGFDGPAALRLHLSSSIDEAGAPPTPFLGYTCSTGSATTWHERAFTFTAPDDAASRPHLSLHAMGEGYQRPSYNLGVDAISLVDVTDCP
jgi:hypothetical protein